MSLYEVGQIFYIHEKKERNKRMAKLHDYYLNAQLSVMAIGSAFSGKELPPFEELFSEIVMEEEKQIYSEEELKVKEANKLDSMFGLYASVVNAKRRDAGK